MRKKITFILLLFFIKIIHPMSLFANSIALIPLYNGEQIHDEILKSCEYMVKEGFFASRRLYPLTFPERLNIKEFIKSEDYGQLKIVAKNYGASSLCLLQLDFDSGVYSLRIKIIDAGSDYLFKDEEKIITATLPSNLSLKGGRFIAERFSRTKLLSTTKSQGGILTINAGQWHGLEIGEYRTNRGLVKVTSVDRFFSKIVGGDINKDDKLEFDLYADTSQFIKNINKKINENTARFYSQEEQLNKRRGSAKESIIATCVINQGANFCLPGYGSFLSMDYLGIKKGECDVSGALAIATITALHFLLPLHINDYKINFFPWIKDNDKENRDQRLQYFLWATIPLTFSVSYYNQLSYNYHKQNLLPPLFSMPDETAAVISIFIPGGGMFYKGYRFAGWSFYLSELSLGGYAFYNWDSRKGKMAASALVILKAFEIGLSYYMTPSYSVFQREIASDKKEPLVSFNLYPEEKGIAIAFGVTEFF